ncbi:MAG: 4-(cytidine 5'-diphospho)-2-C-methyl-D-erythritol kinase [Prevotellaceae bacterium]|jgi:4-diphosphocytidyl-2-C-methyl-D-erythritol kinase|nr:4-(cytidine 5'-diphospho)-2-C-methyl-D-erythritol kinase [Prevotellaceae bacterium]
MIVFPNAKLNLGLNILRKRADGYHDLSTVFYPILLSDALEAVDMTSTQVSFHTHGLPVAGEPENNLVMKAYRLLSRDFSLAPLHIRLYKHIPMGSGLGGGSSDATFMLKLLNERNRLGLSENELENYATQLGADCAFFIRNRPMYAEGIGNIFSPVEVNLAGYGLLVVCPNVFVSTREAFAQVHPALPATDIREIIRRPVNEWRDALTNDFEQSVFPQYPALAALKQELYNQGAAYASMSGSGSSIYALFAPNAEIPQWDTTFSFRCRL